VEESERIGFYSIGINILLVGIKYGLAVFSGSIALVADAIHSLSDLVSSATVLAGIKISKRKSKIFPYGLYKVENLVSLVSSLFIFFAWTISSSITSPRKGKRERVLSHWLTTKGPYPIILVMPRISIWSP